MMHFVLSHFAGSDDVFGSFGLWAFLSVGAVALFAVFLPFTTYLESRRKEREAFYKADTLRRVSEASGDAGKMSIEFLREQNRLVRIQTIEGLKIGGLIMTAVGIGVVALLWALAGHDVAVCGVIPALIGLAMLAYVYFLAAPVE
jgi:hypothetical protein